jgi:hypothetical protein
MNRDRAAGFPSLPRPRTYRISTLRTRLSEPGEGCKVRQDTELFDEGESVQPPRPKLVSVLGLLVLAATTFSYLGAYAVTSALVNAQMIPPISREHDPRLRWALSSFVIIMTVCGIFALVLRLLSRKQFQRIDRMLDADDTDPSTR